MVFLYPELGGTSITDKQVTILFVWGWVLNLTSSCDGRMFQWVSKGLNRPLSPRAGCLLTKCHNWEFVVFFLLFCPCSSCRSLVMLVTLYCCTFLIFLYFRICFAIKYFCKPSFFLLRFSTSAKFSPSCTVHIACWTLCGNDVTTEMCSCGQVCFTIPLLCGTG